LLCIYTDIDKRFAISKNLEYVKSSKNIIGSKLQSGLTYIKNHFSNVKVISISLGHEIYSPSWFEVGNKLLDTNDLVGIDKDYVVDKHSDIIYKRSLNQKKFNNLISNKFSGKYLFISSYQIRIDLINSLNWDIFPDKNNGVELATFNNLCKSCRSISLIDGSYFITIFKGKKLNYSIRYMISKNFIKADEVKELPYEEQTLLNKYSFTNKVDSKNIPVSSSIIIKKCEEEKEEVVEDDNELNIRQIKKMPSTVIFSNKLSQNIKPSKSKSINITKNTDIKVKKQLSIKRRDSQIIRKKRRHIRKVVKPKKYTNEKEPKENKVKIRVSMNDFFDNIFVLSSDMNQSRMIKLDEVLSKYGIFYECINYNGDSKVLREEFNNISNTRIKNVTEYGLLLGHVQALTTARERDYENVLILQDNIILHKNFNNLLQRMVNIPNDWTIIYLGCRNKRRYFNKVNSTNGYYLATDIIGSFSYGIKKTSYSRLLKLLSLRERSVEESLNYFHKNNRCYVLYPNLISFLSYKIPKKRKRIIRETNKIKAPKQKKSLNSNMNKISIVLPTLDGYPLIQRAIRSIFNQSYKDWELIIVNDGSTNKELIDYLNSLHHSKIKIIHLNKNEGLPYALNKGIEQCNGSYWTWISDDNEFLPDCFKLLKEKCDMGCDFVYSDYIYVNQTIIRNKSTTILLDNYDHTNIINKWKGMPCYLWNMNLIKKVGLFDLELYGCEDYDYVVRSLIASDRIFHIRLPLMKYYRLNDTITTRLGDKKINRLRRSINRSYNNIHIYRKLIKAFDNEITLLVMIKNIDDITTYIELCRHYSKTKIKCILVHNNRKESYKQIHNITMISINIFDSFIRRFNIVDGPTIYIYDDVEYIKYEKSFVPDNKMYNIINKVTDNVITVFPKFNYILAFHNLDNKIKKVCPTSILDSHSKFYNTVDKIVSNKNNRNLFNIGVITDSSEISSDIILSYIRSKFKNSRVSYLNPSEIDDYDFVIGYCDDQSLIDNWDERLKDKNIYLISFRIKCYNTSPFIIDKNIHEEIIQNTKFKYIVLLHP
jgi:glycosyltransferase involved in cell wall biosynthesis